MANETVEWLCRNQIIGMALASLQHPDPRTIAACVSSMQPEMLSRFCDGLLTDEEQPWLGGPVFALDGVKHPSNVSKPWSGTIEASPHKQETVEATLAQVLAAPQQSDARDAQPVSMPHMPTGKHDGGGAFIRWSTGLFSLWRGKR